MEFLIGRRLGFALGTGLLMLKLLRKGFVLLAGGGALRGRTKGKFLLLEFSLRSKSRDELLVQFDDNRGSYNPLAGFQLAGHWYTNV